MADQKQFKYRGTVLHERVLDADGKGDWIPCPPSFQKKFEADFQKSKAEAHKQ